MKVSDNVHFAPENAFNSTFAIYIYIKFMFNIISIEFYTCSL